MVSLAKALSSPVPAYHGLKVLSKPRGSLHFQHSQAKKACKKISVAACSSRSSYKRIKEFGMKDLIETTDNFSPDNKIGKGGTADIFRGMLDNKPVAIKRIWPDRQPLDDRPEMYKSLMMFNEELSILSQLNPHPNIVGLFGFVGGYSGERYLILELVKSDLQSLVRGRGLSCRVQLEIAKSVVVGMLHVHDNGFLHLDLKSQNILVDETFRPKLTDFGLSVRVCDPAWESVANHIFDPAYRSTGIYGSSVDVFAFGILMYELLTGHLWIGMGYSALREEWESGDWPMLSAQRLGRLAYHCT